MSKEEKSTREKFNFLKKYYDETWDESGHTLHVGLFKTEQDSLETAYRQATDYLIENTSAILPITKNSVVLDVGCGTGRTLVEICLKYECRGVGVDLSDEQIKDAREHLQKVNDDRVATGNKKIRARFIRASGSDLDKVLKKDGHFTHIISQDAILLITNKQSFFQNIYRLLAPGGVFAVADFLSETEPDERSEKEVNLIYKLVNWNEGLSFNAYKEVLQSIGLSLIKADRRDADMARTYETLARKMEGHMKDGDKTYSELKARYESIATAVKSGKMGWVLLFAQKPGRKTALITGTKEKSIGRFVANVLHAAGWDIWLYSRSAKKVNKLFWHERKCDITSEKSIGKLLDEIKEVDLVMMLADTSGAHGILEELSEDGIKSSIDAKLVGSVLLNKALVRKYSNRDKPFKIIWCAGKPTKKPKQLILYRMLNSGLAAYIEELNDHYKSIFDAYYLLTSLISPSTIGDEYIEKMGPEAKKIAQHPQLIADKVLEILANKVTPGMVDSEKEVL